MEEVEIFINEEVARKVVQFTVRSQLRRLLQESFERHRVVKWLNCNYLSKSVEEAKFNSLLKFFFLFALSLACVLNVTISEPLLTDNRTPHAFTWNYISDQIWPITWKRIVLLGMFAAVAMIGVLATKVMKATKATENADSAPPRTEEVPTISAVVHQV